MYTALAQTANPPAGESEPTTERDALWNMINAYETARVIQVVASLGLADLLADGPRDVSELAAMTGTHAPTLHRLLRASSSVGIFAEDDAGRFSLTPRAHYLRRDVAGSARAWAVMMGSPSFWSTWGALEEAVRTGETAFPKLHGMSNWQYRLQHPEEQAIFDAAMGARSAAATEAIVAAYDFSPFHLLADIGGGNGTLLAAILGANPSLRGILFDQPQVVSQAAEILQPAGITDRCQVVGGDFFQAVPSGADALLLKSVLHDWDDVDALRILRTCRMAMSAGARVLIVEAVLKGPNTPDPMKFTDIRMLVMNGGRERTAVEFEALLTSAGFRLGSIVPTHSAFSIVDGIAV